MRSTEGIGKPLPGTSSERLWSAGRDPYIRNVEAVGSNPITSTKKVQFNGLKVEPGRLQIPRERRDRSLPVFRADCGCSVDGVHHD